MFNFRSSNRRLTRLAVQRKRMVEQHLKKRGISDNLVLAAMASVPREAFVPNCLRHKSYRDRPLSIGFCQTISQPYTVAYMLQMLELCGTEIVLEIGTGSGYGAAVLSQVAKRVYTVERIPELGRTAKERLQRLGYRNVSVHIANGWLGLPSKAPFDAIVVTAGADRVPPDYAGQLTENGQIVIPLGRSPASQRLYRFRLRDGQLEAQDFGGFAFVPLVS